METFKLNLIDADHITGSHSTLRSVDLLPRFTADLALAYELLKSQYAKQNKTFLPHEERLVSNALSLANECESFHLINYNGYDTDYPAELQEEAQNLIQDCIEYLNQIAPEGYYFGSHPGDGADFGYWQWED